MREHGHLCDSELFGLVKSGDETAFSALYRRHWQRMYNGAFKRLQCKDQSQDIVQNIFVDLWERKESVEIANVEAYLHTAVRFQVFKFTSRQPERSAFLQTFEATLPGTFRADDTVLENEVQNLLTLWIEALPDKRREIFLLHCFHGLQTSDIADRLGISQKTVQNQLNTANTELRLRFDKILCIDLIAFSIFLQ